MEHTTKTENPMLRGQLRHWTWTHISCLLLVLLLTGTASATSGRGNGSKKKISIDLAPIAEAASSHGSGSGSDKLVEVIVQFKRPLTGQDHAKIKGLNGRLKKSLKAANGALVMLPAKAVEALANESDVLFMTPNRGLNGASLDRMIQTVGADVAQATGWNGQGVTVAVIDSGISDHPDLRDPVTGQSRIVYNEDFTGSGTAADQFGHGTHVAGIIAGSGQESRYAGYYQMIGVAPQVNLVNFKVLNADGGGNDAGVIAAIQRAIELKDAYNIRIINLSLGRRIFESYRLDPMTRAIEAAHQAGLLVVVSAGNSGRDNSLKTDGYGTITSPGNAPTAITVGAMNTRNSTFKGDDVIATFSSRGPTAVDQVAKPDIVAPGNQIQSLIAPGSTLVQLYPRNQVSAMLTEGDDAVPDYFSLSGTSMAAPAVAGTAAMMLQKDLTLTPDILKARLMKTADKTFPRSHTALVNGYAKVYQYDVFTVGAGYLNIPAALNNTDRPIGSAASPFARKKADGTVILTSNADYYETISIGLFGLKIVSGNTVVWGSSVLWGNSALWGTSVIWGADALLSGTSVVWGSSVVWGNVSLSGNSVIWGASVCWGAGLNAMSAETSDAQAVDGEGDSDEIIIE